MKKAILLLFLFFGLFLYQATADPPVTGQEISVDISHEINADYFLPSGTAMDPNVFVCQCYCPSVIINQTNSDPFIEGLTRLDIGETHSANHFSPFIDKSTNPNFVYLVPY